MRIIAIANQKGGVGKTTTAVTLAHAFALGGYRTLLVDLDPQGNAATMLGMDVQPMLYNLLVLKHTPGQCIQPTGRPNLDILAGDKSTSEAKEAISGKFRRETILADRLRPVYNQYDYVFLDCAPSLDILNVNAMTAANSVIIPVSVEFMSLVGLRGYIDTLAEITQHEYQIHVSAVLPTFMENVTTEAKTTMSQLQEKFGNLLAQPIRRDQRLKEAPAEGKTIFEYDPRSRGALDYTALYKQLTGGTSYGAQSS